MKTLRLLSLLFLLTLLLGGCGLLGDDEEDTSGLVTLQGRVLNATTNNPVPGAFVRVLPINVLREADDEGFYSFEVEIDSTMALEVTASKDGFTTDETEVLAVAGRVIPVPSLRLTQTSVTPTQSGKAANILLQSQSSSTIGVRESGSEEVMQLTFQVTDSLGRPVTLEQAAQVNFRLGQAPAGAFLSPTSAKTDNNGRVAVSLSSGTTAGVVQLLAEANVDGRTLRSQPVAIAIHGGLPAQSHFSLGPARFNFPGLNTYGITNAMSVIVGDKYANPVKPGTAVYFTTTHGVVEGSATTDAQGRGSVQLISANPLPANGIAVVTATTADDRQQPVSSRTPVVFSGVPVVSISPAVAALNQTYTLTVTDQNGNPLAAGTSISVKVEGTKVKAVGNTSLTLDDTGFRDANGDGDIFDYEDVLRGPGITQFTFRAVADLSSETDQGTPVVESITITVSGPNGQLEVVLTPAGAKTFMKQVRLTQQGDGRVEARLQPAF